MAQPRRLHALALAATLLAVLQCFGLLCSGEESSNVLAGRRSGWAALLRVYEADLCKTKKHYITSHNVSIGTDERGGEYVDWFGTFHKPIKYYTKLTITLHRCLGGVAPALCEYVTTWTWMTGLCDLSMMRGVAWTPMIRDAMRPPIYCPIKAGEYHMHHGTFDLDAIQKMGLGAAIFKYIYIVEVNLYDEENVLNLCFNGTVAARRVKLRGRH